MSRITQSTLPKPDTSWRRNRSLDTAMSNQNHKMNMNTAKRSATKLVNVKPPPKSIVPPQYLQPRYLNISPGNGVQMKIPPITAQSTMELCSRHGRLGRWLLGVCYRVKPRSWERHGLRAWIQSASRRLHHNVLASRRS